MQRCALFGKNPRLTNGGVHRAGFCACKRAAVDGNVEWKSEKRLLKNSLDDQHTLFLWDVNSLDAHVSSYEAQWAVRWAARWCVLLR